MRLLRAEWIKLTTVVSHWILWTIGLVFPLLITLLVGLLAGDVDVFDTEDLIDLIAGTSIVSAMLFGVVSTLAITSEFAHQTIRPTLAATPRRVPVFLTKAALVTAVGSVLGLVVWVSNFALGAVVINGRGGDVSFGDEGAVAAAIGAAIFYGLVSLFGYGLGAIFRSSPAAISTLVLWPLLIEGLIALVLLVAQVDESEKFLPYTAGTALLSSVENEVALGRVGGGIYFAVFTIVVAAVGVALNQRRDV